MGDLIIAVSFGLLIPSRIIEHAKFGGLNVHPSFLPKYWGAAPIQHALMNSDSETGVVVQTLHPTKFDAGRILAKSDPLDIKIDYHTHFPPPPDDPKSPYKILESNLANVGADLLSSVITSNLYDPAIQSTLPTITTNERRKPARRLKTELSRILFGEVTAEEVFRKSLVFSNLFCYRKLLPRYPGHVPGPTLRTKMGPFSLPTETEYESFLKKHSAAVQWVYILEVSRKEGEKGCLALQVSPKQWVFVDSFTLEGKKKMHGKEWGHTSPGPVELVSFGPGEDGATQATRKE
ncbi:Methionyl-tRNA formyltransferase [Arthrobotrys musiformis]|uniref:Methionyl-tRNA formyltransferase n=1 Tax=Arthrobotrys musiformis TaxID=47236 RepID=A0AAV9WPP2_9PEZI